MNIEHIQINHNSYSLDTIHDSAVVHLCSRADHAHYTSRSLSPMTGACALKFAIANARSRSTTSREDLTCRILTSGPMSSRATWELARMVTSGMRHNSSRATKSCVVCRDLIMWSTGVPCIVKFIIPFNCTYSPTACTTGVWGKTNKATRNVKPILDIQEKILGYSDEHSFLQMRFHTLTYNKNELKQLDCCTVNWEASTFSYVHTAYRVPKWWRHGLLLQHSDGSKQEILAPGFRQCVGAGYLYC